MKKSWVDPGLQASWVDSAEAEMLYRGRAQTLSISRLIATSRLRPAVLTPSGARHHLLEALDDIHTVQHADLGFTKRRDRGTLILNLRAVPATTRRYLSQLAQEADRYHYSRIALLTGWPEFALGDLLLATEDYGLDLVVTWHLPYLIRELP
jgi:hypothetical protein